MADASEDCAPTKSAQCEQVFLTVLDPPEKEGRQREKACEEDLEDTQGSCWNYPRMQVLLCAGFTFYVMYTKVVLSRNFKIHSKYNFMGMVIDKFIYIKSLKCI